LQSRKLLIRVHHCNRRTNPRNYINYHSLVRAQERDPLKATEKDRERERQRNESLCRVRVKLIKINSDCHLCNDSIAPSYVKARAKSDASSRGEEQRINIRAIPSAGPLRFTQFPAALLERYRWRRETRARTRSCSDARLPLRSPAALMARPLGARRDRIFVISLLPPSLPPPPPPPIHAVHLRQRA